MFRSLFFMECRQMLKSLTYYIYVVVFVIFTVGNGGSSFWGGKLTLPEQSQEESFYGMVVTDDTVTIMERTLAKLVQNACSNSYATYPAGFYKQVILSEEEGKKVWEIIENCTGRSQAEITEEMEQYFADANAGSVMESTMAVNNYKVSPREGMEYEEFKKQMEGVCDIIGKGSDFESIMFENSTYVLQTYEGAVKEYNDILTIDKVTGAFMRQFCDYGGIVLAILPVFLGVTRSLRDKRAKTEQTIYSKEASSAVIILSRYTANVSMTYLPVALMAFLIQQPFTYMAKSLQIAPDYLTFIKYTGVWLLPEIMMVLALSFLLTEICTNVLPIFLQVFWGMASISGAKVLMGDFKLRLVARWNPLGLSEKFAACKQELYWNRGFYVLLAIICIVLAIAVYEKKRRGRMALYGKMDKTCG